MIILWEFFIIKILRMLISIPWCFKNTSSRQNDIVFITQDHTLLFRLEYSLGSLSNEAKATITSWNVSLLQWLFKTNVKGGNTEVNEAFSKKFYRMKWKWGRMSKCTSGSSWFGGGWRCWCSRYTWNAGQCTTRKHRETNQSSIPIKFAKH